LNTSNVFEEQVPLDINSTNVQCSITRVN
jgi:hypothetical protein